MYIQGSQAIKFCNRNEINCKFGYRKTVLMDYTGKKIEKYVVKRLIGEGGMASVYEAEHEVLGTKAAIKVLNPILSTNAQIRERFLNEANHANKITI